MLNAALWVLVAVSLCSSAFCSITCPDGHTCADQTTCCMTSSGYSCCPYPRATCCADKAHCCPNGFRCDLVSQRCVKADEPWISLPMVKKQAAEKPSTPLLPTSDLQEPETNEVLNQEKSTVVHCDSYYTCPDRTTCCRHPKGGWFCCPYSPGRCCLDGFHCCPYGYDCDHTYTHCVRQSLRYPFPRRQALSSVPAAPISPPEEESSLQEKPMTALTEASNAIDEVGVIRCDFTFYCKQGTSCCQGASGKWGCCPFVLGQCCSDGVHCCKHGSTCDTTSMSCKTGYIHTPAGPQEWADTF